MMEWDDSINPRLQPYFPEGQKFIRIRLKEEGDQKEEGWITLMDNAKNWVTKYRDFELRPDDIFVATFPRSGTTWTTELVWLLKNHLDYEKSAVPTMERIPFFDWDSVMAEDPEMQRKMYGSAGKIYQPGGCWRRLHTQSSPRVIKTHLPLCLMPRNVAEKCKVIYVARNPRDVLVSNYHFMRSAEGMDITFDKFFDLFLEDLIWWCPYWKHIKDFWELRNHPNVLFLFFENMKKDYSAAVRRVADFLDMTLTPAEVDQLCEHLSFGSMQKSSGVKLDINGKIVNLLRAGNVGGWRDYFTEDMTSRMDEWIRSNTVDTDITLPE